jgi:hypothetical protein
LCQALQRVYADTGSFAIQWLEVDVNDQSTYHLSHVDKIEAASILTSVKIRRVKKDTFNLLPKQQLLIERRLKKSLSGSDSDDSEDDEDDEDEDNAEDAADTDCDGKFINVMFSTFHCYFIASDR